MSRLHTLALVSLLSAPLFPQEATPKPAAPTPPASRHAALDQLLRTHVQAGLVDYAAIRAKDQELLRGYLEAMAKVDVTALSKAEHFAFHVNVYNAAMIQAVLDHTAKDAKWTPASDKFAVFKEARVQLAGGKATLDAIENQILRPQHKDPRVHVAIVCGARSCPPLLARAYEASDLEAVLTANLAAFLKDTTRNQVDAGKKVVRLSKLFEWFQADFGGEAGVRKLLAQHFDAEVAKYRIDYLEYSWELNQKPAGK